MAYVISQNTNCAYPCTLYDSTVHKETNLQNHTHSGIVTCRRILRTYASSPSIGATPDGGATGAPAGGSAGAGD